MKLNADQIQIVAKTLYRTKNADELAKEFGCKKTYVAYIGSQLRKLGVKIPLTRKGLDYKIIVSNLRRTNPELFK